MFGSLSKPPHYRILSFLCLLLWTRSATPGCVRSSIGDDALAPAAAAPREQLVGADPESLSWAHKTGRPSAQGPGASGGSVPRSSKGRFSSDPTAADASGLTKATRFAKRNRVPLRQSFHAPWRARRVHGRPLSATLISFKARRANSISCVTLLGRIIRDIAAGLMAMRRLDARFGPLLDLAQRVRTQDQHQRGPQCLLLYHSPEVDCILARGQSRAPYRVRLQGHIAPP